jgi:ATP-dependent helicase HepA
MTLIGKFFSDKRYGPAKVISEDGSNYKVEYFISPWNRKIVSASLGKSEPLRLYEQTRVYTTVGGKWRMGRVSLAHERHDLGYDYDIQFPNKKIQRIPEEDLYCRCWLAHDDPTAAIASGGMETQFWHEHRQRFTASLLNQRSACRGISAILSSNIEFVPHQIEVVRRVLEDPLQRYLLADEVGMGKTIEAGLIIRQFLLENSTGDVWVIVPSNIKNQWQRELYNKFNIKEFESRVNICCLEELFEVPSEDLSLLVVDEIHHLVSKQVPVLLEKLAINAKRLLMLSATPSLGNSEILLRLLRLLDPGCYSQVDAKSFSSRVEKREEFGIFLRGLRADANPALIRQRIRVLPELFAGDTEGLELGEDVKKALDEANENELRRSISVLRGYISDVHRIHHRLIRTRRRDSADWVFRPRGLKIDNEEKPDTSHIHLSWIEDSRYEPVFDLFEQWRVQASSKYFSQSPLRIELAGQVVLLFEAFGSGLECFLDCLSNVPPYLMEKEWKLAFQENAHSSSDDYSRSEQVAFELKRQITALEKNNKKLPRLVVFGSNLNDLIACSDALAISIGKNKVLRSWDFSSDAEDVSSNFLLDDKAQILFCTRQQEEGLNLHFADLLVHLDLPFSPSRMEQRIGRLDRFGRKHDQVEQRVFFPSVNEELSLWEAWFDILAEAFHIFNNPIADVQFALEDITNVLSESLLDQGASGLKSSTDIVRKMLLKEREKLDNQYALDQVLQEEFSASNFFQNLDDLEADELEIADATKGWLSDSIGFSCKGDPHKIFRFEWDRNNTLLPLWPWANLLKQGLSGSHTFVRRFSLKSSLGATPQLLRIGSSLMRSVEREYKWDDRGTAFGTWRKLLKPDQNEWCAFKLSYIVEASLPDEISKDEKNSLRTRLDGYLPPWSEVLYLDTDLQVIFDTSYIDLLSKPYKKDDTRSLDFNLGSRQEALFGLIDAQNFEKLCYKIRSESETWLRAQSKFKAKIVQAYERGVIDCQSRIRRLEQRVKSRALAGELEDTGLSNEIELNRKLMLVLDSPKIKLDSIGFIVLSGQTPEEFLGNSL